MQLPDEKKTKGQTIIYKTLHRKQKFEKHEPQKSGMNSDAPESISCYTCGTRSIILVTHVAPVVSFLLQSW